MRFFGAKVVLTPATERGSGMLAKAIELAKAHGWFLTRQFENEANADVHSRTTAREILDDFAGERLDWWVTGFGTGGTLKGVGRVLRAERPDTKIAVCEPDVAPLLGSGTPQTQNADGTYPGHPAFRPHPMQGWSPDFIPKLAADAVAAGYADRVVPVAGPRAIETARALATKEGIFAGISSGATLAGAIEICNAAPAGTSVLCMIPDTGERYLSTPLFADMQADMDGAETEISRSTPNYRFEAKPAA
jgi:cysteine synthase A